MIWKYAYSSVKSICFTRIITERTRRGEGRLSRGLYLCVLYWVLLNLHGVRLLMSGLFSGYFSTDSLIQGVRLEMEIKALYKITGGQPSVAEYMAYRGFCTGTTPTYIMAAISQGIR